jgi:hypothetical protein
MKYLFLFISSFICLQALYAKTLTVSNRPDNPGQFTTVQEAITAAESGDTILVTGSANGYPDFSVDKKLFIFGQGYDPRKDNAFFTAVGTVTFLSASNGSVLSGFQLNYIYMNSADIKIIRNNVSQILFITNDCKVSDNILGIVRAEGNNNLISNNIIYGEIAKGTSGFQQGVIVSNNVFLGETSIRLYNALVINNIFYVKRADPRNVTYTDPTNSGNCIIDNNIFFNTTHPNPLSLELNNNAGSGNLNVDPKFIEFQLNFPTITRLDNLQLRVDSPAKNAGTDGKDIGPYGGAKPMQYPLSGEPPIPQIKSMDISNPIIPVDGTIKVQLKGNAGN